MGFLSGRIRKDKDKPDKSEAMTLIQEWVKTLNETSKKLEDQLAQSEKLKEDGS